MCLSFPIQKGEHYFEGLHVGPFGGVFFWEIPKMVVWRGTNSVCRAGMDKRASSKEPLRFSIRVSRISGGGGEPFSPQERQSRSPPLSVGKPPKKTRGRGGKSTQKWYICVDVLLHTHGAIPSNWLFTARTRRKRKHAICGSLDHKWVWVDFFAGWAWWFPAQETL